MAPIIAEQYEERRFVTYKCSETYGEQKPRGMEGYALGCGHYQVMGTRKWKGHRDWQGKCQRCAKRPRLNPGKVWIYVTKAEALTQADFKNAERARRDA